MTTADDRKSQTVARSGLAEQTPMATACDTIACSVPRECREGRADQQSTRCASASARASLAHAAARTSASSWSREAAQHAPHDRLRIGQARQRGARQGMRSRRRRRATAGLRRGSTAAPAEACASGESGRGVQHGRLREPRRGRRLDQWRARSCRRRRRRRIAAAATRLGLSDHLGQRRHGARRLRASASWRGLRAASCL